MFFSKKQVKALVLYSYAHIARLEQAGKFPKRVQLGPGRVGWVKTEIEDWCQQRIAERDAQLPLFGKHTDSKKPLIDE